MRRSRSGRTFASRWTVATTYGPGASRRRHALARDRREAERRVGHHVADDLDPAGHALGPQRRARALVRAEEERRQPVDLDPGRSSGIDRSPLRSPASTCAIGTPAAAAARAPARVEFVSPRTRTSPGRSASMTARIGAVIAVDVGGAQVEPVRGLREPELVEEDLGELVVPVLARVDDDLLDPGLAQGHAERRGLDELRPVADDGEDALHARREADRPEAAWFSPILVP